MARHDTDPVLARLARAVNESGQARVPVTITAHGTTMTGVLIAEDIYFTELAENSPLLSALQPTSGLLGKEYIKEVEAESAHYLHIRATGRDEEGLWRVSLEAVDAWTVGASAADAQGPFARLLGA
ncbi:MAG TPA: hypothetical protein VMU95_26430 [Trebonia sp.]|nr:hypothetical protein [Trebonia sp.]